jgi:flagellar hook-associated protein 2
MSTGAVTAQQIQQLVQQSLQAELDKIDVIRDEKTALEDKQLAYKNIDNAIESLEDALLTLTRESTYATRIASSSNQDIVSATAATGAAKTSFTFSSITQLATAAKITSEADLGLTEGTAPFLLSSGDINGGADYNPNLTIKNAVQGVNPPIVSGTMTINDVSIDIIANDTLYSILTKINNSGADVVATFDAATDTVRISGTTIGADTELTFNSNGTNFFEALNLDASLTNGTDSEKDQVFDDISAGALSTIGNGFFNINNFTFEINTATDSLQRVINRVNSSNAGAVMFYDEDTGKVTLTNEKTGEPMMLSNDTSGFLSAIGVLDLAGDQNGNAGESTYLGEKAEFVLNGETIQKESNVFTIGGVTFSLSGTFAEEDPDVTVSVSTNPDQTIEHMESFVSQFNATMSVLNNAINEEGGSLERNPILRRLMTNLRTQVLQKIENPGQFNSLIDIGLSFNRGGGLLTLTLDAEALTTALDTDETAVRQLFAYNNDSDGLYDDGGYAYTTRENLRNYTRTATGYFYQESDRLTENIERLSLKIFNKEEKLIDQEDRLFRSLVNTVQALQDLQRQGNSISQINSIVMSSLANSASSVFSASLA